MAVLGAAPIATRVLTATVTYEYDKRGSLVISETAPPDSQLFQDEEEILTSITTESFGSLICSIQMITTKATTNW